MEIGALRDMVQKLTAENEDLKNALEFYGNPESWIDANNDGMHFDVINITDTEPDNFPNNRGEKHWARGDWIAGKKARKVLKEIKGGKIEKTGSYGTLPVRKF